MKVQVKVDIGSTLHAAETEHGPVIQVVCRRGTPRVLWLNQGDAEVMVQVHGQSSVQIVRPDAKPEPAAVVDAPAPARRGRPPKAKPEQDAESASGPRILSEGEMTVDNVRLVDDSGREVEDNDDSEPA